jgi:hypothetical protein
MLDTLVVLVELPVAVVQAVQVARGAVRIKAALVAVVAVG